MLDLDDQTAELPVSVAKPTPPLPTHWPEWVNIGNESHPVLKLGGWTKEEEFAEYEDQLICKRKHDGQAEETIL